MNGTYRPCIWFNNNAEQAASYYAEVFPDVRVENITHYNEAMGDRAGQVLTVHVVIGAQEYIFLNGGPEFPHSENFSIEVLCDGQEEVDRYWNRLVGDGGEESMCGWCKDKFGFSWQIVPQQFYDDMIENPAVTTAMMSMKKLIVADLKAAAEVSRSV